MGKRRTSLRELDRVVAGKPATTNAAGALQRIVTQRPQPRRREHIVQAAAFDHGLPVRSVSRATAPSQTAAVAALSLDEPVLAAEYVEPFTAFVPSTASPAPPSAPPSPGPAVPASPQPAPETPEDAEMEAELAALRQGASAAAPPSAAVVEEDAPFPPPPAPTARAAAAEPAAAEPPQNRHDVFDRMGRGMRYANTFDLGAIALSRRFDAFDAELQREAAAPPPAGGVAAEQETEDDLRTIGALLKLRQNEAVTAPAPPTAAPQPAATPPAPETMPTAPDPREDGEP